MKVWARYVSSTLRLFDEQERLIRQYVLRAGKRIYWVASEDFPPVVRQMMDGGYPAWILEQGRHYGQAALASLSSVLPATLKRMLQAAANRQLFQHVLPLSELGQQMVRDVRYYLNRRSRPPWRFAMSCVSSCDA